MRSEMEDVQAQLDHVKKSKIAADKRSLEDETRARTKLASEARNLQSDLDTLRDQIEEEQEGKADIQRALARAQAETQQWRNKFETEGGARAEELEDAKRRLAAKLAEAENQLDAASIKVQNLEKVKSRMSAEM